jgi:MerR family transcriptional regulator, mercuric resistance operon regulatory protein
MNTRGFTIGKLSQRTGVKIETIRYYEKAGLMPQAPRSKGGHRIYDQPLIDRLFFIRRSRELGFSLDDVRTLMGMGDGEPNCSEVYDLTREHLQSVKAKIADLKKLEKTLSTIAGQCARGATPECPIIDALSGTR